MLALRMRAALGVAWWGLFVFACSNGAARPLSDAGHSLATDGSAAPRDSGAFWGGTDATVPRIGDASVPTIPPITAPDAGDAGLDRCAMRETMEPVVLYLSADDSNSMASPVIARSMITRGLLPPSSILRTYEALNYYDVPYPFPAVDHANVVPELRWNDVATGEFTLQIGVQARPRETPQGRVVTFVLDRSGSMSGEPIAREREVIRALAHVLRAGDIVSWVEWNTVRTTRLEGHVVTGPDDPTLLTLAASVEANGGTDVDGGLAFGYELAARYYDPSRLNRVVLVSDGIANAGNTSIDVIAAHAEDAETDGIYLVGVGVGEGVNDTLMNAVTDAGRGAYVYVDTMEEAHAIFETRFAETMDVGLLSVRVELTLPWYMAIREFHGEEFSVGDPTAVRPQHLSPGDAMVFHQTIQACDPALIDLDDAVHVRATYTRPTGRVMADDVVDTTLGTLLAAPDAGLVRGDAIVAYAEALAALARRREGVPRAGEDASARAADASTRLEAALAIPANADLLPLRALLATAREL